MTGMLYVVEYPVGGGFTMRCILPINGLLTHLIMKNRHFTKMEWMILTSPAWEFYLTNSYLIILMAWKKRHLIILIRLRTKYYMKSLKSVAIHAWSLS